MEILPVSRNWADGSHETLLRVILIEESLNKKIQVASKIFTTEDIQKNTSIFGKVLDMLHPQIFGKNVGVLTYFDPKEKEKSVLSLISKVTALKVQIWQIFILLFYL